jgi:hypothetical protein
MCFFAKTLGGLPEMIMKHQILGFTLGLSLFGTVISAQSFYPIIDTNTYTPAGGLGLLLFRRRK